MISDETLTNIVQKYQTREEPERLLATARRVWRLMLIAGVFICVLSVAGGAYMLLLTFWDMSTANTHGGVSQTLNRAELTRTVRALSERQMLFNELQAGPTTVPDPSR